MNFLNRSRNVEGRRHSIVQWNRVAWRWQVGHSRCSWLASFFMLNSFLGEMYVLCSINMEASLILFGRPSWCMIESAS